MSGKLGRNITDQEKRNIQGKIATSRNADEKRFENINAFSMEWHLTMLKKYAFFQMASFKWLLSNGFNQPLPFRGHEVYRC
jgi:hypothetical protein